MLETSLHAHTRGGVGGRAASPAGGSMRSPPSLRPPSPLRRPTHAAWCVESASRPCVGSPAGVGCLNYWLFPVYWSSGMPAPATPFSPAPTPHRARPWSPLVKWSWLVSQHTPHPLPPSHPPVPVGLWPLAQQPASHPTPPHLIRPRNSVVKWSWLVSKNIIADSAVGVACTYREGGGGGGEGRVGWGSGVGE